MATPCPAFTKEQSRFSSKAANRLVIGTFRACAKACRVESEAEIWPFSILESMPLEIEAALARWPTERWKRWRKSLIWVPMARSSVRSGSCGAFEPVARSISGASGSDDTILQPLRKIRSDCETFRIHGREHLTKGLAWYRLQGSEPRQAIGFRQGKGIDK